MKRSLFLLAPLLLIFVAKPQIVGAQTMPMVEPDCGSPIGQSICQSEALRAAYRNALHALQAQSQFYFGDTLAARDFVRTWRANWQRNWEENCRMDEDVSGVKRSCLLDHIWFASVDARCPLVVNLFGEPGPDRQRAWFNQNEAFCLKEVEHLYRQDG